METLNSILATIDGYVWNIPLIFPLLFVGIRLTVRLGCMQITRLPRAIRFVWRNEKKGREKFPVLEHSAQHLQQPCFVDNRHSGFLRDCLCGNIPEPSRTLFLSGIVSRETKKYHSKNSIFYP